MDGTRFDTLAKALFRAASRRHALVSSLAGTVSVLASAGGGFAKRNHHKRPNHHTVRDEKKKKKKKKKGGGGGALPPASPPPPSPPPSPSPPCVPESQASTCVGAACGRVWNNNCGQPVTCACQRGYDCLTNGTCARRCAGSGDCAGCGGNVACTEVQHCMDTGSLCLDTFQTCDFTSECPPGTLCHPCGVGGRCPPVSVCLGSCDGADACLGGFGACPGGGQCWQPLAGGPTRCGTIAPASCGCTSDTQCEDANHAVGAFCATFVPGGACTCGDARTTFCVEPF